MHLSGFEDIHANVLILDEHGDPIQNVLRADTDLGYYQVWVSLTPFYALKNGASHRDWLIREVSCRPFSIVRKDTGEILAKYEAKDLLIEEEPAQQ